MITPAIAEDGLPSSILRIVQGPCRARVLANRGFRSDINKKLLISKKGVVMAIKQTRDILDYVREFHKKLSDFYHDLADHSDKERVKMLLDYMARHQKHFEENLAEYETDASKTIMESWLQCAPEMDMEGVFKGIKLDPDMMSVEDVIRIAVDLDDYLINLYQEVANCTESKEIKEIFVKLMEKENREKYTLVRQAMRLSDI